MSWFVIIAYNYSTSFRRDRFNHLVQQQLLFIFREKCKNKLHLPNRVCQAHPHNYYLEFLNDVGILGIVIFLIFLVLIFRERILNFKKVKVDEKLILYCLLIIIVSELFPFRSSGSFFSTQISSYIFLILGILGGFKKTKIN